MSDQQKATATSLAGNLLAQTPTLARVAAEGVEFRQTYGQSAICTPSRASMMTGTYPLVHRVLCHQNHAPSNLRQLPEFLADHGYHCVGVGHLETERSLTAGWHDMLDYRGSERLEKALRFHYGSGSRDVGWSAGESAARPDQGHASVLNDELFERLDRLDPNSKPWFLHVAYIEPHPPYFPPQGYLDKTIARDTVDR